MIARDMKREGRLLVKQVKQVKKKSRWRERRGKTPIGMNNG